MVHTANGSAAGGEALASTDAAHLVGLSQADTMKLLGAPAAHKSIPPAQIWTYRSTICDLTLYFYPEVGGAAFRALTYQINDPGTSDATHTACLAGLTKLPAS
jgi:hypothetical protein